MNAWADRVVGQVLIKIVYLLQDSNVHFKLPSTGKTQYRLRILLDCFEC